MKTLAYIVLVLTIGLSSCATLIADPAHPVAVVVAE